MHILTISGSANKDSSNRKLLKALPFLIQQHDFVHFDRLMDFPLFTPERDKDPPPLVFELKNNIKEADIVVISFPEYIHNVPAVLKNALEWVTASGELYGKKVLPISFTPAPPRGKQAMQSLVWSLQALNAIIIAELPLYQSELKITADGQLVGENAIEEIKTVFDFLN